MRGLDYLSLGSGPTQERCAQFGIDADYHRAYRECWVLIRQLLRMFGVPPGEHTDFVVKSCSHDFGNYLEVGITFAAEDDKAREYVFHCEAEFLAEWDSEAREELGACGEVHHGER